MDRGRWISWIARAAALAALGLASPAVAQTQGEAGAHPAGGDADLAHQLANPVASLVSVPFQFNWDQPVGIDDDSRFTLNFQPVMPFAVHEDWNLIVRWIMPYVGQPRLAEGLPTASGLGDIVASFFLSPSKPRGVIWGAGPVFLLPATSDPLLGSGKWGIGPTFVLIKQSGHWTYGGLANHIWSFAGDDFSGGAEREEVSSTLLQPTLSYVTSKAVTLAVNLEASANWKADDPWTVPLTFTVTKLTRFGPLPMSVGGGVAAFIVRPDDGPDWRLRIIATLLLPKGR